MQEITSESVSVEPARDAGARNVTAIAVVFGTALVLFIGYLTWVGFTVAAPTVLWPESSASRDHKYSKGYEPDVPELDVMEIAIKGLSPEEVAVVRRGQELYRKLGCALCHGAYGKGGVTNPNYEKETFPALDTMASKLGLEFPEDVDVAVKILAKGESLDDPSKIDVPDGAGIISGKYTTVRNVIWNPIPEVLPKDLNGDKPIPMPSFKNRLTNAEVNQILASFLVLYPLEEEEWEEEPQQ